MASPKTKAADRNREVARKYVTDQYEIRRAWLERRGTAVISIHDSLDGVMPIETLYGLAMKLKYPANEEKCPTSFYVAAKLFPTVVNWFLSSLRTLYSNVSVQKKMTTSWKADTFDLVDQAIAYTKNMDYDNAQRRAVIYVIYAQLLTVYNEAILR